MSRRLPVKVFALVWALAALALAGCGRAGDADKPSCLICGTMADIRGSIANKSGSQAEMQGWVVCSFEFDTGIARVAEVDSAGLYTLTHVRTDHQQTLALLSPDYILQAVLSIDNDKNPKSIYQWFMFTAPTLPQLIYDSPVITFANLDGIQVEPKLASAQAGNGIPDGATKILGTATPPTSLALSGPGGFGSTDLALSSINGQPQYKNDDDPNIDGDGIINWLNQDENGNSILDVFDPDENSDLLNDLTPEGHNTKQWFTEGVDYIAPQYMYTPAADNTTMQVNMSFATKVADDTTPTTVQIRGAPSLLNNATWTTTDNTGQATQTAWDRRLLDDGKSNDGAAGDRIFGKLVTLAPGLFPRSNEVIFVELAFGTPSSPWYVDYPWLWSNLWADGQPSAITAQYDATTKTVLMVGNPFGTIQDFNWTVSVFDSNNNNIYTSGSTQGTTRQATIPDNIIVAGQSYTFQVTAQSLDKVPARPAYIIQSVKYPLK